MKRIFIVLFLGFTLVFASCSGNGSNQNTAQSENPGVPQKEFTIDELKKYNGQNGNPAYVAVNGIVYDVTNSSRWRNGVHRECSDNSYAGADFSKLINNSPHGTGILKEFSIAGKLK